MQKFFMPDGYQPALEAGEVQVWCFRVGESAAGWLSEEERERAARMRAGLAREEFMLGRSALRRLLGGMLGYGASEVVFATGEQGKLLLAGGGVEFNVAHSHGLVLIVLSRGGAVGIDVEFRNVAVEAEQIAAGSFHAEEAAEICAAGEERLAAFYRCWTRKEAALKADGRGLIDSLHVFSVAPCAVQVGVEGPALEVKLPGASPIWVYDLDLGESFAGALACDGAGFKADFLNGGGLLGE